MPRLNAASGLLLATLTTVAYPFPVRHFHLDTSAISGAMPQHHGWEFASGDSGQGQESQNPPTQSTDSKPAAATQPASSADPGTNDHEIIDPQIITDARAGDAVAQYKLGYDYYLGHGIAQDYTQAAIWWRKAAEQGYADAQNNLGVLYNSGKGVPQSYSEAYFWQNLAASRSNPPLQAQFAKNRDDSASRLSFFERLRVQKRASRWFAEHPIPTAKAGDDKTEPAPAATKPPEATSSKPDTTKSDQPAPSTADTSQKPPK